MSIQMTGGAVETIDDRASQDKVDRLKMMFMSKNPWWACVVVDVPIEVRSHSRAGHDLRLLTKVAATDGSTVYLMPEFFRTATIDVMYSVVCHEYQHIVRMHSYRMEHRDPSVWNVACDHVVNLDILEGGGQLPDGGFHDPKYKGWEEERIYADLTQGGSQKPDQPDAGQAGSGEPQQGGGPMDHGVVIEPRNPDGSAMTMDQLAQKIEDHKSKIRMAQAMQESMGVGDGSSGASRMLSELVEPKRNWREEMRLYVSSKGNPIGRAWNRLDRRSMSIGVWLPAEVKEGMDWVVVGMDVSGSTSQRESDAFIANFTRIRKLIPIKRMTIVPFDTDVIHSDIVELKKGDKYNHEFKWGGGTCVAGLFNWIHRSKSSPDCVIIFSDMDFNYSFDNHGIDPLWVSTTPLKNLRGRPKCGRVIEIGL